MSTPANMDATAAHGHGTDHHDPYLAHHFEDMGQQAEAHSLGLWIFLATEIMFFGGLFVAFICYHVLFPDAFEMASNRLSVSWGVVNTAVLLISSFTMAMAVYSAQTNKRKPLLMYLGITFLCACAFMGVKSIEWTQKAQHHLVPGPNFHFQLDDPTAAETQAPSWPSRRAAILERDPDVERHAQLYYVMYFALTGLHGFHVLCGMGVIAWIFLRAYRGEFNSQWNTPVELTGLYWHLVDLIWIYLFPVIYLANRIIH